ncbi:WD repeat-containing protein 75 [Neodiprion virginianus]|uniref:WD repeat-containing protein 75 n=1 Tax=Neodiprion virginianus TaxID=2961670 RepID=UPI001EE72D68|nr:WD repeat-containing protein 75 [Neodiprion virginianus]XP_046621540.1 WD repeat-containing protein 75 [Neodiprion virginianus]
MRMKRSTGPKSGTPKKKPQEENDLTVKRIGGGSIIDHRPLFSHDGELLFVVWKHSIRAYSTRTGDLVREFEGIEHKIAGISSHPDNRDVVLACSDVGELIYWNCYKGLIIKKTNLQVDDRDAKIRTFHIVRYRTSDGSNVTQALVTYLIERKIHVKLFGVENGKIALRTKLGSISDEYYVDVVGRAGEHLVAVAEDVNLHILNPAEDFEGILHKTGRRCTAVAGHPDRECLATGDSSGRILVWSNIQQRMVIKATYHWHTLPVTEIVFSSTGSHLYSGGGECVMVKWVLDNVQQKSYLPRLPAPIKHLSLASENQYIAISTLDNGIIVINPQKQIISVIQNFTWGVVGARKNLFPAGLIVDPRTNCLVLNSRTGHVQFYNTHTKSLLYNINITAQNLLTQERNTVIANTEVTKVALSQDGLWMGSVEQRDDGLSEMEVRLKFWNFDTDTQMFVLNTSIEYPHNGAVNALQFQPMALLSSDELAVVTTGADKKYKIWRLVEPTSIYKKTKHWQCYSVGLYRNLPAIDATFSMDGSLLAVGFGPTLTTWNPETNELKCSLTHSSYKHIIKRIEFGRNEMGHLVVVGSSNYIAVWNLLTLSITWTVHLKLSTLTADPISVYMAAFTTDGTLYIFIPSSSKPVYTKKTLTDKDSIVLGASFVPHLTAPRHASTNLWQQKSQLFFLDSNQELLTLETASEISKSLENLSLSTNLPSTAFGALIAAQTTTSAEQVVPYTYQELGVPGMGIVQELLSVPSHTLPPMRLLCAPFIFSMISVSPSKQRRKSISKDNSANGETMNDNRDNDSGNESDERFAASRIEISSPNTPKPMDTSDQDEERLIHFDWSLFSHSLSAILLSRDVSEK